MKRTTEHSMKRSMIYRMLVGAVLAVALMPGVAYASDGALTASSAAGKAAQESATETSGQSDTANVSIDDASASRRITVSTDGDEADMLTSSAEALGKAYEAAQEDVLAYEQVQAELTEKILEYDPADIEAIGTQESSGHTICCPSFSCAYADAILDGTVHDHSYYTCSCCTWPDWGGGESSYRCVGTDEEVLREAYDQIAAGRPTVVHVSAGSGEHWIALIGYTGVEDPDSLTLENFIALDPWDGAQIVAADRYVLYGDGCQHISDRA